MLCIDWKHIWMETVRFSHFGRLPTHVAHSVHKVFVLIYFIIKIRGMTQQWPLEVQIYNEGPGSNEEPRQPLYLLSYAHLKTMISSDEEKQPWKTKNLVYTETLVFLLKHINTYSKHDINLNFSSTNIQLHSFPCNIASACDLTFSHSSAVPAHFNLGLAYYSGVLFIQYNNNINNDADNDNNSVCMFKLILARPGMLGITLHEFSYRQWPRTLSPNHILASYLSSCLLSGLWLVVVVFKLLKTTTTTTLLYSMRQT